MRAYCITSMVGGTPDFGGLPYYGHVLLAQVGQQYGVYIVSGTPAQLSGINALPQVYRIGDMAELDDVITPTRRTRINAWLSTRGYPTIPAGWTYRQILDAICKRLLPHFVREMNDVADPDVYCCALSLSRRKNKPARKADNKISAKTKTAARESGKKTTGKTSVQTA